MTAGTDVLRVGAVFPDPPFHSTAGSLPGSLRSSPPEDGSGLDIELMEAIGRKLDRAVEFLRYEGRDFNGIFDALDSGDFDCVTSGTTVTGSRALKAAFCDPYLISGQSQALPA